MLVFRGERKNTAEIVYLDTTGRKKKRTARVLDDGGAFQSRTGLDEFAIRCITALLTRPRD